MATFTAGLFMIFRQFRSVATHLSKRMLSVHPINALGDNYMYLVVDGSTKTAAVVDPVEPEKVLASDVIKSGVKLTHVLTTHHHYDHAGGNEKIAGMVSGLTICGGDDRIGASNKKVSQGDTFKIGSLDVNCLFTPCHTSGHICYYVTDGSGSKVVFTGDTLFIAGCGRFFEGSPQQMYEALVQKLGSLPDDTKVYCGHEYTKKNLQFALTVEPNNEEVQKKLAWVQKNPCTVPSTIGDEKKFNPFMRVDAIGKSMAISDPVEVMGMLRRKKDAF